MALSSNSVGGREEVRRTCRHCPSRTGIFSLVVLKKSWWEIEAMAEGAARYEK